MLSKLFYTLVKFKIEHPEHLHKFSNKSLFFHQRLTFQKNAGIPFHDHIPIVSHSTPTTSYPISHTLQGGAKKTDGAILMPNNSLAYAVFDSDPYPFIGGLVVFGRVPSGYIHFYWWTHQERVQYHGLYCPKKINAKLDRFFFDFQQEKSWTIKIDTTWFWSICHIFLVHAQGPMVNRVIWTRVVDRPFVSVSKSGYTRQIGWVSTSSYHLGMMIKGNMVWYPIDCWLISSIYPLCFN